MKPTKISESGLIGKDGRLRMPMDRVNAFFEAHKGERVVVRFEAAAPGSSALQQAYYYNYIVPCVVQALYEQGTRMTEEQADRWLMELYPAGDTLELMPLVHARQLNQNQMSDFLEWLKQYAAENLYVYIEDSKTL